MAVVHRGLSHAQIMAGQCRARMLPQPVTEFQFAAPRRWRFDFAWPDAKPPLAMEVEGGVFMPGGSRHSRGAGFRADCEKYARAAILGWRVIRVLPEHVQSGVAAEWVEQALRPRAAGE